MPNKNDTFLELINNILSKDLVLPDFQRRFVWKKDMMLKLYTSVLCRMPLGSILILKSPDESFACKEIGANFRSDEYSASIPKGKELSYLIDGQQRLTTLLAGFSTRFLERFLNSDDCAKDFLRDFYFIKIPSLTCTDIDLDIFHAKELNFNATLYKSDKYLQSSIVNKLITSAKASTVIKKKKKNEAYDLTNENQRNQIIQYCTNDGIDNYFRIPLQFINSENSDFQTMLQTILMSIANRFSFDEDPEKKSQKTLNWMMNVIDYLKFCLSNIDLNRIIVDNSNKIRAIDIYSNLNIGGVGLSVFDLLMAKVGTVEKNNFYDLILKYIQNEESKGYPKKLYKDEDKSWLNKKSYLNASTQIAKVIDEKEEEITTQYINVFLNVLSMYITQKNRAPNTPFDVNCIKEDKILELDATKVCSEAKTVCTAIDRALFFFQTRCGIRKLSDINYLAQLVVVAYFFTDDKLFNKKDVFDLFEYWYWISIFADLYPSNQNIEIFKIIPEFERFFSNKKKNIDVINNLQKYEDVVLNKSDYSDEKTLTFSKEARRYPPAVLTDYICQFYLAFGYNDLCTKEKLNFFTQSNLEIHHLMPLGSSPEYKDQKLTYGNSTLKLRKDKTNKYNSPLNMLYITAESNGLISNMDYQTYSQNPKIKNSLALLNCETVISNDYSIDDFLLHRYNGLKAQITTRLSDLYTRITT